MNNKYVVGLDFGTLSGRAVVVRASDGAEMGSAVHEYPHGVMDRTLSAADGRKLPPDFALQDPADYLETLEVIVRGAVDPRVDGVVVARQESCLPGNTHEFSPVLLRMHLSRAPLLCPRRHDERRSASVFPTADGVSLPRAPHLPRGSRAGLHSQSIARTRIGGPRNGVP